MCVCLYTQKKQKHTINIKTNKKNPPPHTHTHTYHTCSDRTVHNTAFDNLLTKEGNVLFNDTLNTFYLWLYSVGHMVKDHSDSERGNPLLPHGLLFPINSKGSFICTIPHRIAHTSLCYTSCGALAGMRNSSNLLTMS